MNRKILLSKRASVKLDKLLIFLEEDWSLKVKKDFIFKLEAALKQIRKLPESFPESDKKPGLRKCVVTRQTTIFYNYSDTSIYIVSLFDNRQNLAKRSHQPQADNPKSLNKEIKHPD